MTGSEPGQPGERPADPDFSGTEVDDYRIVVLDQDDPAEAVLVVVDLIANGELLHGRFLAHRVEGTSGQDAPGRGAGRFHRYQYAPSGPGTPIPGRMWRLPGLPDAPAGRARPPGRLRAAQVRSTPIAKQIHPIVTDPQVRADPIAARHRRYDGHL